MKMIVNEETRLRRSLDRTQEEIWEFHCGNAEVFERARSGAMAEIIEAVSRGVLSPAVAAGLKKRVEEWWY
jgi:hypothetical protein